MKTIKFEESNTVYAENQPEYIPLPCHKAADGVLTICWELDETEIKKVIETGKIWHQVYTFNCPLQPIMLSVDKPEIKL